MTTPATDHQAAADTDRSGGLAVPGLPIRTVPIFCRLNTFGCPDSSSHPSSTQPRGAIRSPYGWIVRGLPE